MILGNAYIPIGQLIGLLILVILTAFISFYVGEDVAEKRTDQKWWNRLSDMEREGRIK